MPANQNQSYADTLRELRATRTQQLRQGGTQAQIMNRQMAALTTMNSLLSKQTQMISRLESSQRNSNQQLASVNRNLTTLSSSLSKSLSNFAASVTRSAGNGVGGAVAGTASAAGSIASSLASGIGKVLPAAIASYVVKSVTWDNMSQETRDKISGSMGSLFNKAFKEIDSTELGHALTKALSPAFSKISSAASAVADKIPSGKSVVNSAKETVQAVKQKLEDPDTVRNATTVGLMTKDVAGAVGTGVRAVYEASQNAGSIPEGAMTAGKLTLGTVGVGAAYLGGKELLGGSSTKTPITAMPSSQPSGGGFKRGGFSVDSKKAADLLKSEGSKLTKANIVMARTFNAVSKLGSGAGKLLTAIKDSKIKKIGILGLLIQYGFLWAFYREIDAMVKLEEMTQEEGDYLKNQALREANASAVGGAIGTGVGLIAAGTESVASLGIGVLAAPTLVVGGGFAGSELGVFGAKITAAPAPEGLNKEITELDKPFPGASDIKNQRKGNASKQKRAELPQANMSPTLRPNLDDLPIEQAMGQYRDIVGQKEGGATGYDAMYGVNKESDVQKYKEKETGGKRLTEMTINEIIALQEKKKGTNTGAMGKYQFMNVAAAAGHAGLKGTDIFSPANQDKMFDAYTKENAKTLKNLKLPVNALTLRLAHAVGPGGVKKLLEANETNPNALPADVLGYAEGSAARKTNPQLSKKGVTVASYLESMNKEVGGISATQIASTSPAAKPDAGTSTTATQTVQAGSEQKPAEDEDQKRRGKIAEMFESTMASFDPEKLTSNLLEKLEVAKTVMMGNGGSGGTTINNYDNSTNTSGGGGGSAPVASGGKSTTPTMPGDVWAHSSLLGSLR